MILIFIWNKEYITKIIIIIGIIRDDIKKYYKRKYNIEGILK